MATGVSVGQEDGERKKKEMGMRAELVCAAITDKNGDAPRFGTQLRQ